LGEIPNLIRRAFARDIRCRPVYDIIIVVRRAFGATSNIVPCAKCARYVGGWYRNHRTSRLWRDIKYRPVRKMRTLTLFLPRKMHNT